MSTQQRVIGLGKLFKGMNMGRHWENEGKNKIWEKHAQLWDPRLYTRMKNNTITVRIWSETVYEYSQHYIVGQRGWIGHENKRMVVEIRWGYTENTAKRLFMINMKRKKNTFKGIKEWTQDKHGKT